MTTCLRPPNVFLTLLCMAIGISGCIEPQIQARVNILQSVKEDPAAKDISDLSDLSLQCNKRAVSEDKMNELLKQGVKIIGSHTWRIPVKYENKWLRRYMETTGTCKGVTYVIQGPSAIIENL